MTDREKPVYEGPGYCPVCENKVVFRADGEWFRDHLLCSSCGSIPRERALMRILAENFPNYRELTIHESSPVSRGVSRKLELQCPGYSTSHYLDHVPRGLTDPDSGFRCEDIESLTYSDDSFDLFITQDVMEHVFSPSLAFREIGRVLRPGGAHVFTVPIAHHHETSQVRASLGEAGETVYHAPPEYHESNVEGSGSLVTMHWGYDIVSWILEASGMPSVIYVINDLSQGIRAELNEVIISRKMPSRPLPVVPLN